MKKVKLIILIIFSSHLCIAQWQKLNTENQIGRVGSFYSTQDSIYAAAENGVFSSSDGLVWNFIGGGSYNGYYFATDVVTNNTAIVEASSYGVYYSNYNNTWNALGSGIPSTEKCLQLVSNGEKFFLRGSKYVYSYDSTTGVWSKENLPDMVNTISSNGKDIFVGLKNNAGAYRLNHGTSAWVPISYYSGKLVKDFFQKDDYVVASYLNSVDSFAVSDDNGNSWIKNNISTLLGTSSSSSFELNDTVLFLGVFKTISSPGFLLTLNEGINWTSANVGLADSSIEALKIFGNYIYASTYNEGFYRRDLSQLSGIIYNGNGQLEAIIMDNASYQWYLNGQLIQGATGRTFQAIQNGVYKVEITFQNPSARMTQSNSLVFEYTVLDITVSTAIKDVLIPNVAINYNPYSQSLQVMRESYNGVSEMVVYNYLGQVIIQKYLVEASEIFDFTNLNAGVYVVKVGSGQKINSFKFSKN